MFVAHSAGQLRSFVLQELGMVATQSHSSTVYAKDGVGFLRLYGKEGLYEFGVADYTGSHDFSAQFSCHDELLRFGTMYEGRTFFRMEGSRESSFLPSVFVTYEREVRGTQKWWRGQRLRGAEFTLYPAFYEAVYDGFRDCYAKPPQAALEANRTYRFMPMEMVALVERLVEADRAGRLGPLAVQAAALEALDAIMGAGQGEKAGNPFASAGTPSRYPLAGERGVVFTPDELRLLEEARDTLDRTYAHPPTIEALAQTLGINAQKLKTGFQRLYRTTIGRYVLDLRMTQAALLLRTTSVPVEVVSARVGHAHPSNFIKTFRRTYSCTPAQYRRQES